MKTAVRYYTRSGNTEKLARAIAEAIGVQAEPVSADVNGKTDIVFLGCSYYAFDVDEAIKQFISENRDRIGRIVCFGTSAMMKSTHKPMKKVCDASGVALAHEEFDCRGSFGPMHKGHPDETDLKAAAAFAKAYVNKV